MSEFIYRIRLASDGQPETGLGGESVDSFVPKDPQGRLMIAASHIKGLIREQLACFCEQLGWHPLWAELLLGKPDTSGLSRFVLRILDARAEPNVLPYRVTRTAIDESGTAKDSSLRTNELIPVGTVFKGRLHAGTSLNNDPLSEVLDKLWKLCLLTIPAIGGNRTRGCGQCVFELEGVNDSPKKLLLDLHDQLQQPPPQGDETLGPRVLPNLSDSENLPNEPAVLLDLVFVADAPICCPERADKTNMLQSGIAIPASAVQGAILHRLRAVDPALSDKAFADQRFRAWPLLPAALQHTDAIPWPTRVSLTHRAAKYALGETYESQHFQDAAIAPYKWNEVPRGAPLKAYDGVLLNDSNGSLALWKASAMPKVVTAHGVHRDPNIEGGRNLFTVDSMAPMVWRGLLAVPPAIADSIIACFESDPFIAFGKSRTVRGGGKLLVAQVADVPSMRSGLTGDRDILVVQSPLLIPDREGLSTAENVFKEMLNDWAKLHGLQLPEIEECWATTSIQFGWNRFTEAGRLNASRTLEPGSAVRFDGLLPDGARKALLLGIGKGRERGFGAVAFHPGKATCMFTSRSEPVKKAGPANFKEAVRLVLTHSSSHSQLPSVSQVRALQQRVELDSQAAALTYLDRQLNERNSALFAVWKPHEKVLRQLLDAQQFSQNVSSRALTLLAHRAADQRELATQHTGVSQ